MDRGYAVVDVETSGLSPTNDHVLEIGIVLLDHNCQVEGEWTTRIRQPFGRSVGPTHIHGLTWWSLRHGDSIESAMSHTADLLRSRTMVAHNAPFDSGFLRSEANRCGFQMQINGPLCTLDMARQITQSSQHVSHRLADVCARYEIRPVQAHRALEDARACAQLLPKLLAELAITEPLQTPQT